MIYLTSDLHFGHWNIIAYCNRPYSSAEEMDEALIANWNDTVKPRDEVYILGDFTLGLPSHAHNYLTRLKGRKYFIRGNHDRFLDNYESHISDFEWVKDYHVLKVNGRRIVLFHFPILEWDQIHRGAIHCYGHVHNSPESAERLALLDGPAFNVGVDVNGFRPVSLVEILKRADGFKGGK